MGLNKGLITRLATDYLSRVFIRGLGRTLFIRFLVVAIVPMVFVGAISVQQMVQSFNLSRTEGLAAVARAKHSDLSHYFDFTLTNIRVQAELENTVNFLLALKSARASSDQSLAKFTHSFQWASLEDQYGSDLSHFLTNYSYIDLLLLDEQGNVLYSIRRDDDLGNNLFTGDYSASRFALAAKEALQTGAAIYSDMEHYPPFNNQISSFLVQAVVDEYGDKLGLLAIHLSPDTITSIMEQQILGHSGKAYLVGEDLLMRSNDGLGAQSSLLETRVETSSTKEWFERLQGGQASGGKIQIAESAYKNYRGVSVLGVGLPIDFAGTPLLMLAEFEEAEALLLAEDLIERTIGIGILTLILVLLFSIISARSITQPIIQLTNWARELSNGALVKRTVQTSDNEIGILNQTFLELVDSLQQISSVMEALALGDLSRKIPPRSADDIVVTRLNHLNESMQAVVNQADEIAQGNYETNIQMRSAQDTLGIALRTMTKSLSNAQKETQRQNWLKTSQTALAEVLRGNQDPAALSSKLVTYLVELLGGQIGLLYTVDTQSSSDQLCFAAGYACEAQARLKNTIAIGEGLAGQAALSQEMTVVTNLPGDYLTVNSALGDSVPSHILLFPFVSNGQVGGMVEVGKFGPFSDAQLELLRLSSEPIAIAFNACFNLKETKALLEESQGQSEALKVQQEELKSTNETLISQTLELKASEEELKQQSEELKVSNEELQSKQQALLNQKEVLKKAETDLLANADKLMQSSQYKSDFLANMSHELRTPLNSLLILSKLLADNREGNLTQGQLEDAKMIHEGGQDLLNLIGDIMDMSKVEAGKLTIIDEEVQLDDVLENLDGMFSSIAKEKQVAFNCQLDTGMPQFIVTDEQRLLQILKNFLSNAFKFTSKGSVTIEVHRPQAAMQFMHEDLNADNTIAFSVTDTGIGIEDNKQNAIFEAFQQADGSTSRKYGGTGLGLSISTKLASLLGGEIGLHSETDKGSTFTLYLPLQKTLCQDDELQTAEALEPVEAQASNELFISDDRDNLSELENTVLIIEDDVKFAKILLQIARDMKFKGIVTNRGRDGLYLAMNYPLQGILIDAGLSDIDGTLMLEHLQHSSHTRDIPVHVISGRNGKQTYLNRGAKSFLCKPAAQDDIESIFRALVESKNKQVTVLLIEDDQKQQKAISRLLESKQLSLLCVSTGEEAFERLNNQLIDGIILDLGLDDMDGQAILKKLHGTPAWCDIPVVIHTGQEISAEQHRKLSALSMDIIIKGSESPERLLADVSLFFDNISKQTVKQNKPIAVFHDSEAMLKGRRILLVDDDMRNVFALSKVLGNSGLIVTMADNGQTALDKLSEADGNNRLKASAADPTQAPIELIIMDIMMPVMDGYEAMRRIRKMKSYADIPIIALTAKAMHEDLEKCMAAGASEYITKPVDIEQLMSMLNIWLYKTHEK